MTVSYRVRPLLITSLVAMFLQGCGGGGSEPTTQGVNGTYLHISAPEFYFGTRNVGPRDGQVWHLQSRCAHQAEDRQVHGQRLAFKRHSASGQHGGWSNDDLAQ